MQTQSNDYMVVLSTLDSLCGSISIGVASACPHTCDALIGRLKSFSWSHASGQLQEFGNRKKVWFTMAAITKRSPCRPMHVPTLRSRVRIRSDRYPGTEVVECRQSPTVMPEYRSEHACESCDMYYDGAASGVCYVSYKRGTCSVCKTTTTTMTTMS